MFRVQLKEQWRDMTPLAGARTTRGTIPLSPMGVVTASGIALGDLATSILYAFKAVVLGQGGSLDPRQVTGLLSLIFWVVMLSATVKYAAIVMRADNRGEGGVFAMFTLVRRYWRYMPMVAIVGGSFLLADSVFTPSNSILSAVEGLASIDAVREGAAWGEPLAMTLAIAIIVALFAVQHSGVGRMGRLFGPVMIVYLLLSAGMGAYWLAQEPGILRALDPTEGIRFFLSSDNKAGLAVLSGVFLAITGSEALAADQGQLGRSNIRVAWGLACVCIMLSYFGQGAYMLLHPGTVITPESPATYFLMMPEAMRPLGVVLALLAGVIASQALITAAFSLASAADGLGWLPRLRVSYTGATKGQVYIPAINLLLCALCVFVVLFFRSSAGMEAAYGLALIVAMLMDTVMLWFWFVFLRRRRVLGTVLCALFGGMELLFLVSSSTKFLDGGYVTVLMAVLMMAVMTVNMRGQWLERSHRHHIRARRMQEILDDFVSDDKVDLVADNLVYLTADQDLDSVERDVAASMVRHRAHVYWVVSVVQTDAPFTCEYALRSTGRLERVLIRLGYRMPQYRLQTYMRHIMRDALRTGELRKRPPAYPELASRDERAGLGSVRYVFMHRVISPESELPERDQLALRLYQMLKRLMARPIAWFGLESSDPLVETVSMFRGDEPQVDIVRRERPARPAAGASESESAGASAAVRSRRSAQAR